MRREKNIAERQRRYEQRREALRKRRMRKKQNSPPESLSFFADSAADGSVVRYPPVMEKV